MSEQTPAIVMTIDGAEWVYDEERGIWEHKGADGVQISVIPWRAREAQQLSRALGIDPDGANIYLSRQHEWVYSCDEWYTETELWQIRIWYDDLRGWLVGAKGYGYAEGLGDIERELASLRLPDALVEAEALIGELWGYEIGEWRYDSVSQAYCGIVGGRRVELYWGYDSRTWRAEIYSDDGVERVNTYLDDPRCAKEWMEGIYGKKESGSTLE